MRIAFFTGPFPAYSETFVIRQIAALRRSGHEVLVFPQEHGNFRAFHPDLLEDSFSSNVYYPPKLPEFPPLRILQAILMVLSRGRQFLSPPWRNVINPRVGGSYAKTLRLLFWAWPFLHAPQEFDAIVSHFETPANRVTLLRKAGIIRGPHAAIFHTTFFFNEKDTSTALLRDVGLLCTQTFPSAEVFLPIHSRLAEKMIEYGADRERVRVLHMGCGAPVRRSASGSATLLLLSVCRLVEKKGLDDAIEALSLLRKRLPAWEYHILGDGPMRANLVELAQRCGVSDNIHFHGAQPTSEVAKWMSRADIFLAPSKHSKTGDVEGIPVSVIEATSAGIPVVATFHEGIPECVLNGKTGFLVPEGAHQDLAACIEKLAVSPDLRCRFSLEGVKQGRDHFDQISLDKELEDILSKLGACYHGISSSS